MKAESWMDVLTAFFGEVIIIFFCFVWDISLKTPWLPERNTFSFIHLFDWSIQIKVC